MNILSPRRRQQPYEPRHAGSPFREPEQTLAEALAEQQAAEEAARQDVPGAAPEGATPYEDIPVTEALARPDRTPSPLDNDIAVQVTAAPVIAETVVPPWPPEPAPEAPVPLEYRVPLDSRAALYSGPGWTEALIWARISSGEWVDPAALLHRTGRACRRSLASAAMDAQDTIGECWRQVCAEAGRPDLLVPGWKMIRDLAREAAKEAANSRQPSFTPAADLTRPQPALTEGWRAA
jgi:hypothetical protein